MRLTVVLVILGLPAACGTGPAPAQTPSSPATASISGSPTPASALPASPSPASASPVELTLAFGGDVHFIGRTLPLLDEPQTAFGPIAGQLRAADFAMVNLESAVTTRGQPQPKKYLFRAPTAAYEALKGAGIDLVSLANNHALDYGQTGLLDTLASARAAGMPVVGAGRNTTEAYEPYVATVRGVKLAVVALSQVHELSAQWKPTATRPGIAMAFDKRLSVEAVRQARTMGDVVIVYMHWGTEGSPCPNAEQKSFAKLLADAGANIVVGTHAHIPQGDGFLGQTYVHYGLGNFLWYGPSKSTDSGLLTVRIQSGKVTNRTFTPAVINTTGQPIPATGRTLTALHQRLDHATTCSGLARDPA